MKHIDEAGAINSAVWKKEVEKGGGHTLPGSYSHESA